MAQKETEIEIDEKVDWITLNEILKAEYDTNGLILKYIDDENDEIDINTQNEYENAFTLAALTDTTLKFVIKKPNGKTVDRISVKIKKQPVEEIKRIKPTTSTTTTKIDEEKLINFDSTINLSTMIDSKIVNSEIVAAFPPCIDRNLIKGEENAPKWFTDGINNLKKEILIELSDQIKQIIDKIGELKVDDNNRQLNNSCNVIIDADAEPNLLLSMETIQKLVNQLEEAKFLKDVTKVKDIEEKLTTLNAFNAEFLRDCNIPDGTKFEVKTKFKKSWLLKNSGRLEWLAPKVKLINIAGNIFCENNCIELPFVDINGLIEIEVELITPDKPGVYVSEWVLAYQNYIFGPRIWCDIEVVDNNSKTSQIVETTTTTTTTPLIPTTVNLEIKIPEIVPIDKQQHQLESPLLLSPTAFKRKLSSSTTIDEKLKDLADISDDDDAEFVIIPDCLNLNKKWEPLIKSTDNLNLSFPEATNKQHENNNGVGGGEEQINSSMMLLNELLLIPKRQQDDKLNNLMTFSDSIKSDDGDDEDKNEFNCSIEKINESNLNDTLKEDKNLLSFSDDDYSNLNGLVINTENKVDVVDQAAFCAHIDNKKIEEETNTSANATGTTAAVAAAAAPVIVTPVGINIVLPSAPEEPLSQSARNSLNQQYSSLDPNARLVSMGFCNRQLNNRLLEKYNNDMQRVIDDLLNRQDNDWASNRH